MLPPPRAPQQLAPQQIAILREESASSHHSLVAEIDQFRFEEGEGAPKRPVELSDSRTESNKFAAVHYPRLIVAQPNTSSKEENMDLKKRLGLKGMMASRGKGSSSKDIPDTQVLANLPPPPSPLVTTVGLLPNPDLKKKRKVLEMEKGEIVPQKDTKQPKNAKDKWAPFVESREETSVDMC